MVSVLQQQKPRMGKHRHHETHIQLVNKLTFSDATASAQGSNFQEAEHNVCIEIPCINTYLTQPHSNVFSMICIKVMFLTADPCGSNSLL